MVKVYVKPVTLTDRKGTAKSATQKTVRFFGVVVYTKVVEHPQITSEDEYFYYPSI